MARARIVGLTARELQDIRSRKRWDEATARRVLDALRESGLSPAAFSTQTGIGAWRLRDWQRRLGEVQSEPVRFLPVRVRGASPVAHQMAGAVLEVTTPSGFQVRAEGGFELDDLVRLIAGLERPGC